jgi:hypothetical protein
MEEDKNGSARRAIIGAEIEAGLGGDDRDGGYR